VIDAEGMGWSKEKTVLEALALNPKLVGFTATSYTLHIVEQFASCFKAAGVTVMVGGPHASVAPQNLFDECPSVDIVVRGEGEMVIEAILHEVMSDGLVDIPGVCRRVDGQCWISDDISRVKDFAVLPFPRLEGLPIDRYWCPDALRRPMVTMMTSRGCPHRCGFCASPTIMGKKVRGWGVEAVLDEIESLVEKHGVKEISFVDDVFTIQNGRAIALCRGLVERKLDLTWFCNARADQVTDELADAMALAGCHQVYLGFESGSPEILARIQKGSTLERLEDGARLLKKAGISRSIGFVIGLPGETDETVKQSIAAAQRVRPERLQFTRWTPLHGSPLYSEGVLSQRNGFHAREQDNVGQWITQAYEACLGYSWGAESW